jgi:hypothetical protein
MENISGFHVEPSLERVLPGTKKGSPMGTTEQCFLVLDSTFYLSMILKEINDEVHTGEMRIAGACPSEQREII